MASVTIYQFLKYDIMTDTAPISRRWGTSDAIRNLVRGEVLEATGVTVDASAVESDITGLTAKDYRPVPYVGGFQRQVRG